MLKKKTLFAFLIMFCVLAAGNKTAEAETADELEPLIQAKEKEKIAYLTFDDGPSLNTQSILTILDQYKVKATFFVKANEEPYAKRAYKEMVNQGHVVALHSYTHDYSIVYRSKESFFQDLNRLESFLADRYGIHSKIVRLPGGSNNMLSNTAAKRPVFENILHSLNEKGYTYFDWHVDSQDGFSPNTSADEIIRNVLTGARGMDRCVILLHDINSMKNTVKALPSLIESLESQGYSFGVLDRDTPKIQFK
ncbi:polysaccharide deacetylase family protein [Bacillus massiliglaciei]|uniref:polysaccharide deacetylase family protein n=1 Tax=Bacillus massiliglaciei TaxID=1816693 RepID=UPI000AE04E56|nr:polysaccharide deacetylase family protein [Bacillus massiliglaciei]